MQSLNRMVEVLPDGFPSQDSDFNPTCIKCGIRYASRNEDCSPDLLCSRCRSKNSESICEPCASGDHAAHDVSVYLLGCQNEGCNCRVPEKPQEEAWHARKSELEAEEGKHDWEPGGADGICIHCGKDEQDGDHTEKCCYYCGEPLINGLCDASCHGSEGDEGRDCECEDGGD